MFTKEESKLDLRKQLSILLVSGLEIRVPRGMVLGRLPLGTLDLWCQRSSAKERALVSGLSGPLCGERPSYPSGFCGDGHKGFPEALWSPGWTQLGKQLLAGCGGCSLRSTALHLLLFHPSFLLQDYSTPEIIVYSEKGLKGEQVELTDALEDTQGLEKPLQAASATVSAGL